MVDRFQRGQTALEATEVPDLWEDARRRADAGEDLPSVAPHRTVRVLAAAAIATVAAVAGYVLLSRDAEQPVTTTPGTTSILPATEPCRPGGASGLLGTTTPPDGFEATSSDSLPATGGSGDPPHVASYFTGPGDGVVTVFDGPLPRPAAMSSVSTPVGPALVGTRGGRTIAEVTISTFGPECRIGLEGSAVGVDAIEQLLGGLFLADGAGRPLLHPDGAVWPETGPFLAGPDQPAWRDDQVETALEFARQILGWDDAVAPIDQREPSEDGRFGGVIGVERSDQPGRVSVSVGPTLGGRWLGVYSVEQCCPSAGDDGFASVQVLLDEQTGIAGAGPTPVDAVAQRVRFDHNGRIATAEFSYVGLGVPFDLGYAPDSTGSALVLYLGTDGEVLSAWGRPLPAGDFAAG